MALLDASNPYPHFKTIKKLYHFTSRDYLHGIGRFGLTVGDVLALSAGVVALGVSRAMSYFGLF